MAADEAKSCRLLGGIFASFIQACLALLCIATLVVKRQQEVPRRDWLVWFLDVMKQGLGSSFGHFSNIYLSMVIAGSVAAGDECQWYCLTYVIDCTLGTCLNLTFLHLFEKLLKRYPNYQGLLTFGEYGDPPQLCIWFPQLLVWLSFVITSKTIIVLTLSQLIAPIDAIISELFYPLRNQPRLELVTVMIIIPTILNTLQFWVTDTFLKHRTDNASTRLLAADYDDGESDCPLDEELISEGAFNNSAFHKSDKRKQKKLKSWKSGQKYTQLGSSSPMSTAASDDIENDIDNNNNASQNYLTTLAAKAVHSFQPAMNSMFVSTGLNRFWRRHMTNPRPSTMSRSSSSRESSTSRPSTSRPSTPNNKQQSNRRRGGGIDEWKYANATSDGIELGDVLDDDDDDDSKPNYHNSGGL